MVNKFHNTMPKGQGPRPKSPAKDPGFREKPGFSTGVPGKKQPRDRSAGVKRAKIHPTSEGL